MKRYKIGLMIVSAAMAVALAGCGPIPTASVDIQSQPTAVVDIQAQPTAAVSSVQAAVTDNSGKLIVQLEDEKDTSSITVTANGTIKVTPDVAYTTVGVVTQKKKMQDAQSANKELMNAVVTALKAAGLTDDDIRTTNYSVNPIYDYSGDTSKIASFEVNNTVELTIRDIENVGNILDAAAAAGANTSYSVRFDLLDNEPSYNKALTAAMESAKAKADTIATAGGCTIKGVLNVSEGYTSNTVYREYAAMEAPAADEATFVSAGDLDITATVTVVYDIG